MSTEFRAAIAGEFLKLQAELIVMQTRRFRASKPRSWG